jgi:UDP-sugar pyrophosphorylase
MTSDDTHDRTLELLRSNAYFGLHESQVTLLKQGKVASLVDNDAHIAVSPHDPMELDTKPHGHGDVHFLLYASDLPRRWVEEGRKWIVFFQDTNALCFRSLPAAIGVSASRSFHMNSMTVPRAVRPPTPHSLSQAPLLTHTTGPRGSRRHRQAHQAFGRVARHQRRVQSAGPPAPVRSPSNLRARS